MDKLVCAHCNRPIDDEECYQLSDRAGNATGWIHVECHSGYKERSNKSKIDASFTACYNWIYDSNEDSASKAIQNKWRANSDTRYNAAKLKIYKEQFDNAGPNGIMLNDLVKNFTEHPNALRMMIRTVFRYPSHKKRAFEGILSNKHNPLLPDLMLLEAIVCIYDGETLIADKMLTMLHDIEKDYSIKAITGLLKNSILVPSNIYRTSVLMKIINNDDPSKVIDMCLELPNNLLWDGSNLFERIDDIELKLLQPKVLKMIQKYEDRPIAWAGLCNDVFKREAIRSNNALTSKIVEVSKKIISSGDLEMDIVRYSDRNWSKRIVWLIETLGLPEYSMKGQLLELKQLCLAMGIWNDDCSHAMFRISEPEVYQALRSNETIFDS